MIRLLLSFFIVLFGCQSPKKTEVDSKKNPDEAPKLTKPIVRKVWVPPTVEDGGKTYRDGHFIYVLSKESVWSQ